MNECLAHSVCTIYISSVLWTELRVPQNPHVKAPTTNVIVFEDTAFREVIRLNEVIEVGPKSYGPGALIRRGNATQDGSLS